MILNEPEKLWIITCFMAMSGTTFDEVAGNYNKAAQRIIAAAKKSFTNNQNSEDAEPSAAAGVEKRGRPAR